MRTVFRIAFATALGLALFNAANAAPADDADLQALREQVRQLDQQLRVLARKLELKEEEAAAAAKSTAKVSLTDKGFTLSSADGANSIKLRGLAQLDSRVFFGADGASSNAFVLRRARIITEGTFAKNYSFQFVPEFGGSGAPSILDANIGLKLSDAAQIKAGKFKSPVGLEQLQSDSWTFFNERSIVSNLVPNRDLGVQVSGDVAGGLVAYAVGVFGGVADAGSTTNTDFDNEKDIVARVTTTPFKHAADNPLQGLTFGVAASLGREKTASGRTSGYRTDGQQTFFSYLGTTVADGQSWRVSPQVDFRRGPFGAIGEYVVSTVNVRPSATGAKAALQNTAWQLAAGYVLTGEDSSYNGVVPATTFNLANGTWGAFEIVGRYANVRIDDAAFPVFASPAASAEEASSIGLGLNWYLSKVVRFSVDYYQTHFGFADGAPAASSTPFLRQDEKVLITRLQLSF